MSNVYFALLQKRVKECKEVCQNAQTEQHKVAAVFAFRYLFDLSWKTMKQYLYHRGLYAHSPRQIFRLSAREGFIEDLELWFKFAKNRNVPLCTENENAYGRNEYGDDVAINALLIFPQEVLNCPSLFIDEVEKLIIFFETKTW